MRRTSWMRRRRRHGQHIFPHATTTEKIREAMRQDSGIMELPPLQFNCAARFAVPHIIKCTLSHMCVLRKTHSHRVMCIICLCNQEQLYWRFLLLLLCFCCWQHTLDWCPTQHTTQAIGKVDGDGRWACVYQTTYMLAVRETRRWLQAMKKPDMFWRSTLPRTRALSGIHS